VSLAVMTRFARTRETPEWANPGSLLEGNYDFGFGWGFGNDLLGGLPSGAREIVGQIWGAVKSGTGRVVIAPIPPPAPPPPVPVEEEEMAHDWGHLFREVAGDLLGVANPAAQPILYPSVYDPVGFGAPAPAPSATITSIGTPQMLANECGLDGQVWSGQAPPKGYKVVNYCGNAVLRKIRRRRRRRILSASDAADIATIVGLVGKGQMASALINRRP